MVDSQIVPRILLNNGAQMPVVGLGTWQSPPDETVYNAVKGAIENGYRHIDCAFVYGNQKEIGQAIADCISANVVNGFFFMWNTFFGTNFLSFFQVKREDLFIVSKIWITYYQKDRVELCLKKILADLKLDYLDLILLHWPMSLKQVDEIRLPIDEFGKAIDGNVDYLEAYQALELLQEQGLAKSIGISNFNVSQVERLLMAARIQPVVNQVECHPYLNQKELKAFCEERDIKLTAFSPLGNPGSQINNATDKDKILKDPVVTRLAEKYNKNSGQILIKFQVNFF